MRGNRIVKVVILALFAFTMSGAAFGEASPVIDANICDLVAHPKKFDKMRLRIRARIISSIHGAALFDMQNASCGIRLWIAKAARDNPDQKALNDAIWQERAKGAAGKEIIATYTGVLLRNPKHRKKLVLEADKVEDISLAQDP